MTILKSSTILMIFKILKKKQLNNKLLKITAAFKKSSKTCSSKMNFLTFS